MGETSAPTTAQAGIGSTRPPILGPTGLAVEVYTRAKATGVLQWSTMDIGRQTIAPSCTIFYVKFRFDMSYSTGLYKEID